MKIERIEPTIVSVPYSHRETSSRVRRDGVTAVLVKVTTDDGRVGWGVPGPMSKAFTRPFDRLSPCSPGAIRGNVTPSPQTSTEPPTGIIAK